MPSPEPLDRREAVASIPSLVQEAFHAAWEQEIRQGRFADVTFRVAGVDFQLSRMPFAVSSPVFAALLYPGEGGAWKEHDSGVVTLQDVAPETFEQIARHAYRMDMQLTAQNVMSIRKAADMYQMPWAVEKCDLCMEALLDNSAPHNALILLSSELELFGSPDTYGKHAVKFGGAVFKSPVFKTLPAKAVQWLLSSDLRADEDDVWLACRAWALERSSDAAGGTWQEEMQVLCDYIRFPVISHRRFDIEIVRSGLLSTDREIDILLHSRGSVLMNSCMGPRVQMVLGPESRSRVEFKTPERVYASPTFESGTHSWTVAWESGESGGIAGIASADWRGYEIDWRGYEASAIKVGFSLNGSLTVRRPSPARVAITINIEEGTIVLDDQDGCTFRGLCQLLKNHRQICAFVESSANNVFSIRYGKHL